MRSRHIVICIAHPAGEREPDLGLEGLRAAVGLVRSTEAHAIDVVLEGEGVRWLSGECTSEARAMLSQLRSADVCWYAVQAAVEAHELGAALEGITAVDDAALAELLEGADVVLRY